MTLFFEDDNVTDEQFEAAWFSLTPTEQVACANEQITEATYTRDSLLTFQESCGEYLTPKQAASLDGMLATLDHIQDNAHRLKVRARAREIEGLESLL